MQNGTEVGLKKKASLTSVRGVEKILDACNLVMNEEVVAQAIRRSVLDSIEEGLIINAKWYQGNSFEEIRVHWMMLPVQMMKEILLPIFYSLLWCWLR